MEDYGSMNPGGHLAVSTTNGESMKSFELKEDTPKGLLLKDKYKSGTWNEIKCWKSL